jgi:hypothetical protein
MAAHPPVPQPTPIDQLDEPKGRASIISAVKTPLGFFALVVLITEVILGGLAARATGLDFTLLVIGMLIVLISLIVVVAVGELSGRSAKVNTNQLTEPVSPTASRHETKVTNIVDERLEYDLRKVRDNVQEAAKRTNPVLKEEISEELNRLVIESEKWSRGELHIPVARYDSVLINLYDNATESIFSTTIRDYLATWPNELMEKMIDASERSRATTVTRVFVFANRNEIDQKAIEVFRRFLKSSKIRSLVFIDAEGYGFNFPPEVSKDFVVIDQGEVIGVTMSYGQENLTAVWHFGDTSKKPRFEKTCKNLESRSKSADAIINWWEESHTEHTP